MIDLVFKRLALVRNWIIYSIQCIHCHLMTFVIQSMGQQFTKKIKKVECLSEIIEIHDLYIETIYEHCFQKSHDVAIRKAIEQLLNLVVILYDEWNNIDSLKAIDDNGGMFSSADEDSSDDSNNIFNLSVAVTQVDNIEATYINCHCLIAEILSSQVCTRDRSDCKFISEYFVL